MSMVWVNGERQPDDGPHVSARDRGLTLADGLFETMRLWGGVVFRLDRHLERLSRGLAALEIPEPADVRQQIAAAAQHADLAAASIRVTVTRGTGPGGVAPPADVRPTTIVTVGPMPDFADAIYTAGLSAHVVSGRRNQRAMTAGLKTLAYTDAVAALLAARRRGADEALFLDTDGHCSEATASNLFALIDGVLATPPVSCGALPGVTRAAVLELAGALGLTAAERVFDVADLRRAGEAFLTSSLRGLAPLVRVGGAPIGSGAPGRATRQLAEAYDDLVKRECTA